MLPKILSTRSDLLDLSGQWLLRRVTQDETTVDARLLARARVNNEAGGNLAVETGKPARIRPSTFRTGNW